MCESVFVTDDVVFVISVISVFLLNYNSDQQLQLIIFANIFSLFVGLPLYKQSLTLQGSPENVE